MEMFKNLIFIMLILAINHSAIKVKTENNSSQALNFSAILATNITLDTLRLLIEKQRTSLCQKSSSIYSYPASCPTRYTQASNQCILNCKDSNYLLNVIDKSCTLVKCDVGFREVQPGVCSSYSKPSYNMASRNYFTTSANLNDIGECFNQAYFHTWGQCHYSCSGFGAYTNCSTSLCGVIGSVCDERFNTLSRDLVKNVIPKVGDNNYDLYRTDFLNKYSSLSSDLKSASITSIINFRNNRSTLIQTYLFTIIIELKRLYPAVSTTELSNIANSTLNDLVNKLNTTISSFNLSSFTLQVVVNKINECTTSNLLDCSKKIMSVLSNADTTGLMSGAFSILNNC